MEDRIGGMPPPVRQSPTPMGLDLDDVRQRLVPGVWVLLNELQDLPRVRSKYLSTKNSTWVRTLVPGHIVVPAVRNSHKVDGQPNRGDLWLMLRKED